MSHIYVNMYAKYMYPNMSKFIASCMCVSGVRGDQRSTETGISSTRGFNNIKDHRTGRHLTADKTQWKTQDLIIIIIIHFICGCLSRHSRTPYNNKIHN